MRAPWSNVDFDGIWRTLVVSAALGPVWLLALVLWADGPWWEGIRPRWAAAPALLCASVLSSCTAGLLCRRLIERLGGWALLLIAPCLLAIGSLVASSYLMLALFVIVSGSLGFWLEVPLDFALALLLLAPIGCLIALVMAPVTLPLAVLQTCALRWVLVGRLRKGGSGPAAVGVAPVEAS